MSDKATFRQCVETNSVAIELFSLIHGQLPIAPAVAHRANGTANLPRVRVDLLQCLRFAEEILDFEALDLADCVKNAQQNEEERELKRHEARHEKRIAAE